MPTARGCGCRAALLAVVAAAVAAPAAIWAQAVSPADYDVPVSTAQQVRLGATFHYTGAGGDVQASDGAANLVGNRFYNSLPFAYDMTMSAIGSTRRTAADKQKNSYNLVGEAGVRRYFQPDGDSFYSVDGRVTADNEYDRPALEVTPGAGYGRFIRVTTLAKAVRIEDFLLQEDVIQGPLPKEIMVELAQVIEREGEYQSEYGDRYKVKWFEAMEKAIGRSGMFTQQGLGAAGSLRVEEVLFEERINERYIGWDARAGVRFELLTEDRHRDREDPSFSGRLRFSRPLGWESQLDLNTQYTTPFNGDFGVNVYALTATLNYLYELSNRVDFTASNIVTARRLDPDLETLIHEQVRVGFLFYLENQVNLNVSGQASKVRGGDANQGMNVALEYRLR
jgi:hypothetical protein